MDENNINNTINTLGNNTIPTTVYYLGFLFTAGAVIGSIIGIYLSKKTK